MSQIASKGPLGLKPDKLTPAEIRAGKAWMARVKELPCAVCRKHGPSDAHHVICGRYGTRKAPDTDTIPLCKDCHQNGPNAIHNGKESWVERNGPDYSYLPWVEMVLENLG